MARIGLATLVLIAVESGGASLGGVTSADDAEPTLHSDDGHVMRATLESGAVVELTGGIDVRLAGTRVRVRHASGLRAAARAEDLEVVVGRATQSRSGAIELGCDAHVTLRSAEGSTVRLEVFGLGLHVREVVVPREVLALRGGVGPGPCGSPRPPRFDGTMRRLLPGATLWERVGGRRVPVSLTHGAYVVPGPSRDGFTEIALEDSGTRIVAWADGRALEPASTPPSHTGGGGLGEGRIGLSACPEEGARAVELVSPVTLHPTASSAAVLATLAAPLTARFGTVSRGRVPVLALPGVSRVGRCARPIGWIATGAVEPR